MPRYTNLQTFMRVPASKDLGSADVAIIGFPFDTGATWRVGARFGPAAIRQATAGLRPYHPTWRLAPLEHLKVVDYGDVQVVPGYTSETVDRASAELKDALVPTCVPIFLGGDHTVSFPELRAVAHHHGPVALVHFDAHTDTWDQQWGQPIGHGTPFWNALQEGLIDPGASIQLGLRGSLSVDGDWERPQRLGFEVVTMAEVDPFDADALAGRIRRRVGDRPVFLSFDIDALDPAYAPATGTPEVGGFTTREVIAVLRRLAGLRFVGFDLVEVLPQLDAPAQITAVAAANIVYEFLGLLAAARTPTQIGP